MDSGDYKLHHFMDMNTQEWKKEFHKRFSNHTNEFINPWHGDHTRLQNELIDFITTLEAKNKADWLRSEIEKLEGEIEKPPVGGQAYNRIHRIGMNTAITSIITRYKEELLELDNVK